MGALAIPVNIAVSVFKGLISVVALVLSVRYLPALITALGETVPAAIAALSFQVSQLTFMFSFLGPVLLLIAAIIATISFTRSIQQLKELTLGWRAWTRETRNAILQNEMLQKFIDKTNAKFGTHAETLEEVAKINERVRQTEEKLAEGLGVTIEEFRKIASETGKYDKQMKEAANSVGDFTNLQTELDQQIALVNGTMKESEQALTDLESLYDGLRSGLKKIDADKVATSIENLTDYIINKH